MTGSSWHIGDVVHRDKHGGDIVFGAKYENSRPDRAPSKAVILLVSANPVLTSPLHIGEERRAIDRAITLARADERLETRSADSARRQDLQQALTIHQPAAVHFIGHGTGQDGIVLVDRYGQPRPVPTGALSELFRVLGGTIRCVVLNACFTEEQAVAIGRHIPCVVGMTGRVSDLAAVQFATSFYQAAATGCSIQAAFDLARNSLAMSGYPEVDLPVLVAAERTASTTVITNGSSRA